MPPKLYYEVDGEDFEVVMTGEVRPRPFGLPDLYEIATVSGIEVFDVRGSKAPYRSTWYSNEWVTREDPRLTATCAPIEFNLDEIEPIQF